MSRSNDLLQLWRDKHRDHFRVQARSYYYKHAQKRKDYSKQYRLKNRNKVASSLKNWRLKNRDHIRKYDRLRRAINPQAAMKHRMSSRLLKLIKMANGRKRHTVREITGTSPFGLVKHMESLFRDGMTWGNRHLWHIDHIKPCTLFDLTSPEGQRACFHYTNLQPLWSGDNMRKWKHFPVKV